MSEKAEQGCGEGRKPPPPPCVATGNPDEGGKFPPELYAPAIEGPIIHPRSRPRIVKEQT